MRVRTVCAVACRPVTGWTTARRAERGIAVKLRVLAVAAVATALCVGAGSALAGARGPRPAGSSAAGPRHVRVLVLTMFSGETQPWLAHLKLPVTVAVPGGYGPLHCDSGGLCVTTIGQGKSNAGPSVTAILADRMLSFRGAYFMTAGIAGTPPSEGTLGFAAWARYVADWDSRASPDSPHRPWPSLRLRAARSGQLRRGLPAERGPGADGVPGDPARPAGRLPASRPEPGALPRPGRPQTVRGIVRHRGRG